MGDESALREWLADVSTTGTAADGVPVRIKRIDDSLCLGVENDGNVVQQRPESGRQAQLWVAHQTEDMTMVLTNQKYDEVLEVEGGSIKNGGNIQVGSNHGKPHQQWWVHPLDDGSAKFVNVNSCRVVDVNNESGDPGANIHQWEWNDDIEEHWIVQKQ